MSQSLGNYVGITEPPDEQFGKLMSIPDELDRRSTCACARRWADEEVDAIEAGLADGSLHPNEQKRRMAREIVDLYHGPGAGHDAEARFDQVHKQHELPDDVPERPIPADALRDGQGLASEGCWWGRAWRPRTGRPGALSSRAGCGSTASRSTTRRPSSSRRRCAARSSRWAAAGSSASSRALSRHDALGRTMELMGRGSCRGSVVTPG